MEKIVICLGCGNKYHIKNFSYRLDTINYCHNCCFDKLQGKRVRDHLKLRKVRSDKKSIGHKREIVRIRVKRWRNKKMGLKIKNPALSKYATEGNIKRYAGNKENNSMLKTKFVIKTTD